MNNDILNEVISVINEEIDIQILVHENLRFRDIMLAQIEKLKSLII